MSKHTPVQSSTVSVSHASSLVSSKVSQLNSIFATPRLATESPSSADVMQDNFHFPSSEDSEGSSGILTPGTPISLSSNSYDAVEEDTDNDQTRKTGRPATSAPKSYPAKTKTRDPEETEAEDLEQPTKKVKLSTSDHQYSLRHKKRSQPKVATEPKTPKKKKKKKKKRKAPFNKQINPLSVKSTSKSSMQRLLRENADITRKAALLEPYLVDIEVLTPLMLDKYTGNDANVPIFLQFLVEEVEICPLDVTKVLKSWGNPKQADFASRLARFALESEAGDLNKTWGKVASTLFNIFASIAWPHKSKSIKPLWRCFYGVRFRFQRLPDGLSAPTTPSTPSTASWDSGTSTSLRSRTASWDSGTSAKPRVKHRSLTSSRVSQNSTSYRPHFSSHTASYPLKKAARQNVFIPYYDVLQNEHTYVVRIFLPLVTPQEMKSIKIDSNLSRKTLNISGTYIPGSNIGQNLVGLFGIRRPLQPIFYQPANHYGPFDLQVALPSDIQDYKDSVKVGHECWGVAFQYVRRKQIEHASIHLSSCFGSCHVESDEKIIPDSTVDQSSTSAVNTANDVLNHAVPERSNQQFDALAEAASSNIAPVRPTLLGRSVSVPGEMWGAQYNGTTYTGYVRKCTRNTVGPNAGFDTYRVVFEDCTDEFSLSDLKSFGVIAEDEFTLLFDKDTQF